MRKIQIIKRWKEIVDGKEMEVSLIEGLNALISMKKPEDMPRGVDKARMFGRFMKSFDKAKENNELVLEESDYNFLKKAIEEEMPSVWGKNPDMMENIEVFLEAKQEEK